MSNIQIRSQGRRAPEADTEVEQEVADRSRPRVPARTANSQNRAPAPRRALRAVASMAPAAPEPIYVAVHSEAPPKFEFQEDITDFLKDYNRFATANNWTEAEKVRRLYSCLPRNVADYLEVFCAEHQELISWSVVRNALVREYGPKEDHVSSHEKLMQRKQEKGESCRAYIDAFEQICQKLPEPINESIKVTIAINNLDEPLRSQMYQKRRKIANMRNFKDKLLQAEINLKFNTNSRSARAPAFFSANNTRSASQSPDRSGEQKKVRFSSPFPKPENVADDEVQPATFTAFNESLDRLHKRLATMEQRLTALNRSRSRSQSQEREPAGYAQDTDRSRSPHNRPPQFQRFAPQNQSFGSNYRRPFRSITCHNCGKLGHIASVEVPQASIKAPAASTASQKTKGGGRGSNRPTLFRNASPCLLLFFRHSMFNC